MLAHAETAILPALLLLLILYPASIWILFRGVARKHNAFTIWCALFITIGGAAGAIAVMTDFEWPPDKALLVSLGFWLFPLSSGLLALLMVKRARTKSSEDGR